MLFRALAFAALIFAAWPARAQEAVANGLPSRGALAAKQVSAESAWLDLRQTSTAHSTPQTAPA